MKAIRGSSRAVLPTLPRAQYPIPRPTSCCSLGRISPISTSPFFFTKQHRPHHRPQALTTASPAAKDPTPTPSRPLLPRLNVLSQSPEEAGACEGIELILANTDTGYWVQTLTAIKGWPIPTWPMIIYTIYTVLAVWTMETRFQSMLTDPGSAKLFQGLQSSVQLVGTALFFLLTFRVNSSYSRWWEGANLWSQVTAICFGIGRIVRGGNIRSRRISRKLLRATMCYIITLQASLHGVDAIRNLSDIVTAQELQDLKQEPAKLRPQLSLQMIQMSVRDAQSAGVLEPCATIELHQAAPQLTTAMRSMQRISSTPMPFAYIAHLRLFLVIWLAVLPVVFSYNLGYYAVGCSTVIGYALMGMEAICLEVEFPFGRDFSDLPVSKMAAETLQVLLTAYTSTAQLDAPNPIGQDDTSALGAALEALSRAQQQQ